MQGVGVDILVVFLLLVGVILLTGASLAGALRATGSGLADTTRMMRALAGRAADPAGRTRARARSRLRASAAERVTVSAPEPAPDELVVRATHVEGPSQEDRRAELEDAAGGIGGDGAQPAVDARAGELGRRAVRRTSRRRSPGSRAPIRPTLTPQGRLRDAVTDDPDFVWELPDAGKLLTRSTGEQARPDTAGQERIATSLVEALGHFGVQAKVIGTVAGPAHHAL